MPKANANGIEIEYESIGNEGDPVLLLIMGLGAQLVAWDSEFCDLLAGRGLRVVRFDNRDVGLSTKLGHLGAPEVASAMAAGMRGERFDVPYTFDDMADDTAGLLAALSVDAAHVVGASLGGMVAQQFAIRHPDRTRSLTSIMSTPGERDLPGPKPDAMKQLMLPPATSREQMLDRAVAGNRIMSGRFPGDPERIRERAALAYDRCFYPEGMRRQLLASIGSGGRAEALGALEVPALVIHGSEDPLVLPACGEATAEAIPGAKFEIIDGMGHDLPREAWPQIVDSIAKHVSR